jgi:hypothetical protein
MHAKMESLDVRLKCLEGGVEALSYKVIVMEKKIYVKRASQKS